MCFVMDSNELSAQLTFQTADWLLQRRLTPLLDESDLKSECEQPRDTHTGLTAAPSSPSSQNLNFTGFRKILKKHDKILETSRGADWRVAHVEVAPFYTCKKITQLISETEVPSTHPN